MVVIALVLVAIAAVIVIGWLVVGLVLKLLWWALIGLAVGAIARLILPGKQTVSVLATAGVGIAAAIIGGILAHVFDLGGFLQFLIAIALAMVFVGLLSGRRLSRI